VQIRESSVTCPFMPAEGMCACGRAHRDRQQVSAGARASPSWIGGRRRPTRGNPTCTYYCVKLDDESMAKFEYIRSDNGDGAAMKVGSVVCGLDVSEQRLLSQLGTRLVSRAGVQLPHVDAHAAGHAIGNPGLTTAQASLSTGIGIAQITFVTEVAVSQSVLH
jgi:hypothetical protein